VRHSRTVRGRDPGLGQPPLSQQGPQPAGVRSVGLGAALRAAQGTRFGRLGEMRRGARLAQRLADEQPARAGPNCDVEFLAGEAPDPLANSLRRGADAASLDLPRLIVRDDGEGCELSNMERGRSVARPEGRGHASPPWG
jgi:hypothetical protein